MHKVTWKDLRRAGFNFSVPFQLDLPHGEPSVYCGEIVRLVPGKRMVVFGVWQNQPVVVKLFYEKRHAKRHLHREIAGVDTLVAAGTLTPRILYQGAAKTKHIQLLIFERIVAAKSVDELWQGKKSIADVLPLMTAVTIELAAQHVSGILQHDLHLKNFLVSGKRVYTLDGGSIESIHEPLPKKISLDNLALFFSQLGVGTEALQETLFACYVKSRGWLVTPSDLKYLQAMLKKWSELRWQQYNKKVMRRCSDFNQLTSFSHIMMYDRHEDSAELLALLKQPEKIFDRPETTLLKVGRSSTVATFTCDHRRYVVKRYNLKNAWHWFRRCLRPTRAATSWRLAHLLRLAGIPVVKPIAFVENRFFGLRGRSYLIMEYVDGTESGEFFADKSNRSQFGAVAQRTLAVFEHLAALRVTHGDLKKTNIVIRDGNPVLLDLDGTVEHTSQRAVKRAYQQEMKRFMRNWEHDTATYAMFMNYLQAAQKEGRYVNQTIT